jgi:hypothetical protein
MSLFFDVSTEGSTATCPRNSRLGELPKILFFGHIDHEMIPGFAQWQVQPRPSLFAFSKSACQRDGFSWMRYRA